MMRLVALILALLVAGWASAEAGWPDSEWARPAPKRPAVKAWRAPPKPDLRTPGPLSIAPQCQPAFRTVGDQALTLSGAREAAEKAFQQQARFSWGERFADVANARDVTFECVRSSIGSVAGQVFMRCEIRARPCMAPQEGPGK